MDDKLFMDLHITIYNLYTTFYSLKVDTEDELEIVHWFKEWHLKKNICTFKHSLHWPFFLMS